jgi:hypothetical protein
MVDVIGAGFGRTGTASLKVALEHLGLGPCHHMFEVVAHPELLPRWERVVAGEDVDWDEVLEGYRSTVDWPGCAYWRELMETYPHAKVILTVRDPERWYDSAYDTIYQFAAETGGDPQEDDVVAGLQRMRPMVEKLIWEGTFDDRFEDRAHAIGVFAEHNAEVRRSVPGDRLLVYQVDQGWQPLCDHLGVDVPADPFPHINQGQSIRELVQTVLAGGRLPTPLDPMR